MQGPRKQYTDNLFKKFGYYATWEPNVPLELGDIGVLKKNEFTRVTTLGSKGISFEVRSDPSASKLEYATSGGVSTTIKLAGKPAPQGSVLGEADAGFIVEFGRENAILFQSNGSTTPSILDQDALGKEILKLYESGDWKKNWVVITELVEAKSGTVLISNSSQGRIELKATANIGTEAIDIADASANFEHAFHKDIGTKIVAEQGLTPLFKLKGIKSRWLGDPEFQDRSLKSGEIPVEPTDAEKEDYFGSIDYQM